MQRTTKWRSFDDYEQFLSAAFPLFEEALKENTRRGCPHIDVTDKDSVAVKAFLRQGTFGPVYRCKLRRTGAMVAVKVRHKASVKALEDIVMEERNIMRSFESPFTPIIEGTSSDAENLFLVMEFAHHGDLHDFYERFSPLHEEDAVIVAAQLICAIEYIHSCQIIHRHLRLQNCLLFEGCRIKITNFLLARKASASLFGFTADPVYAAPEMCEGVPYAEGVDWYALGTILFMLIFGKPPFNLQEYETVKRRARLARLQKKVFSEKSFKGEISPEARDLIERLLEKEPPKRAGFHGAREVKSHPLFEKINFLDVVTEGSPVYFKHLSKDGEPGKGTDGSQPEYVMGRDIREGDPKYPVYTGLGKRDPVWKYY